MLAIGQEIHHLHQGPLPHPDILAGYENILPGAADRIITLAESEATHRREIEKKAVEAEIAGLRDEAKDTSRGQFCGLIIGLAAIFSGAYSATHGAQWAGGFIGAGGVIGLVSAFIIGRKSTKNNHTPSPSKEPDKPTPPPAKN